MHLAEPDRTAAFFRCWTRKEAYIKAVGDGLGVSLDSFRVTLGPGVAPKMLCLGGSADAASAWTLHEFSPGPEFVGALAHRDRPRPTLIQQLLTVNQLLDRLQA